MILHANWGRRQRVTEDVQQGWNDIQSHWLCQNVGRGSGVRDLKCKTCGTQLGWRADQVAGWCQIQAGRRGTCGEGPRIGKVAANCAKAGVVGLANVSRSEDTDNLHLLRDGQDALTGVSLNGCARIAYGNGILKAAEISGCAGKLSGGGIK